MRPTICFLALLAAVSCARSEPRDSDAAAERAPASERREERERMVREQIEARGVTDPLVLEAMRAVPRHRFVPPGVAEMAYSDGPLPIGSRQTISQPYIVALMTEALGLTRGSKVLEIGTGSGYQAAVLAEITPRVFTIEIVADLAASARRALEAEGYGSVRCRVGDGYRGWPEEAPFDAVIVTAAPAVVPAALFEQLAVGGRLCIPVGGAPFGQELLLIEKGPGGERLERRLAGVRFVPMTGEAQKR